MEVSITTGVHGDQDSVWVRKAWEGDHLIELRIGDPGTGSPTTRRTPMTSSKARQLAYMLMAAAEEIDEDGV